jgi:hypothetical protein
MLASAFHPSRPRVLALAAAALSATCVSLSASADTFRIEIDYMVGTHSHKPSQLVLDTVIQMFACQGHTLIIDLDDALPHYNTLVRDPDNCDGSLFDYDGASNSFGALRDQYFDHADAGNWHYCIFAHNYQDDNCNLTSSSGLAERPGWNFIVSLGSFSSSTGTPFDQAATLAHEFGHNLGLTHCGTMECGDSSDPDWVGPYTPNLASIMSYRYQLAGVRANMLFNNLAPDEALFKNIDYSHGTMCGLNEDNLNEFFGTGMVPTDWNCNGTLQSGVAQDINGGNSGWCGSNGNRTTLSDYNEWNVIGDPSLASKPVEVSCITAEEWQDVLQTSLAGGFTQPDLAVEPCVGGRNVYIGAGILPVGTCSLPFPSVATAHSVAPNGSVFFFKPGVYDESGVVTLNKPGIYLCYIGTAEVK